MTRTIHQLPPGEIPEGRAEFVLSLCAYAQQRTLEPVLEPGVTGEAPGRGPDELPADPPIGHCLASGTRKRGQLTLGAPLGFRGVDGAFLWHLLPDSGKVEEKCILQRSDVSASDGVCPLHVRLQKEAITASVLST